MHEPGYSLAQRPPRWRQLVGISLLVLVAGLLVGSMFLVDRLGQGAEPKATAARRAH